MKTTGLVWIFSLLLKLILAVVLPLSPDEAYYWLWGQNLRLSYFDHPPFVAWLASLGAYIDSVEGMVRWPGLLLAHLGVLFWCDLLRLHGYSWEKINQALFFFFVCPMTGLGAIVLTPDLPLFFFWSGTLWATEKYLKNPSENWAALVGLFWGFGFLSKYHIVILMMISILWTITSGEWRKIRPKSLLISLLIFLATSSPVLIWNFQNNFASFRFQLEHGLGGDTWSFRWTTDYVLGTVALLSPLAFWFFLKHSQNKKLSLIYWTGAGTLLFFLFSSYRGHVELNWPLMAYPPVLILASLSIGVLARKIYYLYWLLIYLFLLSSPQFGIPRHGKLQEPFMLRQMKDLPDQWSPLYTSNYQMASTLWYYRKNPVYKIPRASRYDFLDELFKGTLPIRFYLLAEAHQDPQELLDKNTWLFHVVHRPAEKLLLYEVQRK
ncbi:MAG: glycosyltransferase family 39 protein [Bdellovibrionaceae bacterium]|nr:glycosyltransferase family 39 protein [Pseudobdellovibrionaceae bacterium]